MEGLIVEGQALKGIIDVKSPEACASTRQVYTDTEREQLG
jgi:hypothetical protein